MSNKNKLQKFAEIDTFPNVFQHDKNLKGQWKSKVFKNDNPLVLELACGKGEYSVGQGRMFPDKNFLGLDIKGNRIWKGARTALDEGLNNVAFLRCMIHNIEEYFDALGTKRKKFHYWDRDGKHYDVSDYEQIRKKGLELPL